MASNKNFLALDLELEGKEIIQVGVCIGNAGQSEEEYTLKKWYLKPQALISEFITGLTGITQSDVDTLSVTHEQLAKELGELITEHNCFVNPVTWGGGDSQALLKEFADRGVEFPFFGRRWIDVKTIHVFNMIAQSKSLSGGLGSAMGKYNLKFIGNAHQADVDAFNTMRLWFRLIERQQMFEGMKNIFKNMY